MQGYEWRATLDQEDHAEAPCEEPECPNHADHGYAVRLWPPQGMDSAEDHFFCRDHLAAAEKLKSKLEIQAMTLND